MKIYKAYAPFTVPVMLLVPEVVSAKGSVKKIYPENGEIMYCSFKTFGGTEVQRDGVLVLENTANLQTWYRPDVNSDCKIKLENGDLYEIIGEPENIDHRNQYLSFKVRGVKGGA